MSQNKGRVTIPTNLDVVKETQDIVEEWGADAIRDCDGTEFPAELKDTGAKIYATYYTTRKDNAWAKANPEENKDLIVRVAGFSAYFVTLADAVQDEIIARTSQTW